MTTSVEVLPDLVARIESEESAIVARCQRLPLLARPFVCAVSVIAAPEAKFPAQVPPQ